ASLWLRLRLRDDLVGRERGADECDARVALSRLDWLAVGDRLGLPLRCQLEIAEVSLAQRAIFVGLRDEGVQPPLNVTALDCLGEPLAHVEIRARDRVYL